MKKVIIGSLFLNSAFVPLAAAALIYKANSNGYVSAAWLLIVATFLVLAAFCLISLRLYNRGHETGVTNSWLLAMAIGVTFLALDAAAGFLLIKPLSPTIVHDDIVHHRLSPSAVSKIEKSEFSTTITTNKFGMRGDEISEQKPPEHYRILLLGDSFTMGIGVEDNETFSALLERSLNAEGGRRIEVLNGGVNSYTPLLSYLLLRDRLGRLNPDLVVLNFDMSDLMQEEVYRNIANFGSDGDILGVPAVAPGSTSRVFDITYRVKLWIFSHLYFSRLVIVYAEQIGTAAQKPTVETVVELANPSLLAHTLKGDTVDRSQQWANIFDSIRRVDEYCERRSIQFFMTIYPWGHQVSDDEWVPGRRHFIPDRAAISDKSVEVLELMSQENGIDLLNLFPAFRARQQDGPIYYDLDMHWRPIGHEIMAEQLENYIRAEYMGGPVEPARPRR